MRKLIRPLHSCEFRLATVTGVDPALQLPGHPEVLVVGDGASLDGLPMLAQVAAQQGRHAARVIEGQLRGRTPERFRYRDYGSWRRSATTRRRPSSGHCA